MQTSSYSPFFLQLFYIEYWLRRTPGKFVSYQWDASEPSSQQDHENPTHEDPDVALILKYQQGDTQAFEVLFHKWKRPLISFLYRSLGNLSEAEELALEVFIKVHQSIHRYKPTAKFSSYLFFIGRRLMLNHIRKQKRKPLEFIDPADLSFHAQLETDSNQQKNEMEEMFEKALLKLPELQRTALLLQTQQQLQTHEIAEIIGKKDSATRVMIHRARQTLKTELENLK